MSVGETFLLSASEPRYDPLHNVGRALIDAAAQLNGAVDERARAFGISGAQWTVLIRIGGGIATTASELCQSIGQDSGSMKRMLDRLEKLGLIRRSPSSEDGRALKLALTRKGEELYPHLSPIAVDVLDRHLSGFTDAETERLIGFLERLIANGRNAGTECHEEAQPVPIGESPMKSTFMPIHQAACMATVLALGGVLAPGAASAQTTDTSGVTEMQNENILAAHDLSLLAAQKLLAQGQEIAAGRDMRLSIAVVDRAGNLLAFARMDGASIVTIEVALGKARTAAFLKAPSKLFEDMINSGAPSMATTPGLLPLQGGIPVLSGDEVIGAVGVSGSSGDNDQAVAMQIAGAFADL